MNAELLAACLLQGCFLDRLSVLHDLLTHQQESSQATSNLHHLKLEVLQLNGVMEGDPGNSSSSSSSNGQPAAEDISSRQTETLSPSAIVGHAAEAACSIASLQELRFAAADMRHIIPRDLPRFDMCEAGIRGLLSVANFQVRSAALSSA
jgi:hypothetical protein